MPSRSVTPQCFLKTRDCELVDTKQRPVDSLPLVFLDLKQQNGLRRKDRRPGSKISFALIRGQSFSLIYIMQLSRSVSRMSVLSGSFAGKTLSPVGKCCQIENIANIACRNP